MNEQQMQSIMYASVTIVCQNLNDGELAALNLTAQLDYDPHGRLFDYNAVESLFTESGGTRMHSITKEALAAYVNQRLGGA